MKKLIIILAISKSIFAFENDSIEKIRKEIARQAGTATCLTRVSNWFKMNANDCLKSNTRPEDKKGVIAYHRFPLALTERLSQFKHRYMMNDDGQHISATCGIIKFKDHDGRDVYKPVVFEITRALIQKGDEENFIEMVNHRAATNKPLSPHMKTDLAEIKEDLDAYIEIMKTMEVGEPGKIHSDGSYEYASSPNKSIIVAKSNRFEGLEAMALLDPISVQKKVGPTTEKAKKTNAFPPKPKINPWGKKN